MNGDRNGNRRVSGRLAWLAPALAAAAIAAGCTASSEAPDQGKPPVAVDVVPARAAAQSDTIAVVGSLAPKFEASVRSEYAGIVEEVHVAQWVRVRKGQPLATLDTREGRVLLQRAKAGLDAARAALAQADVQARRAEREAERSTELKAAGLATQQQLDDSFSARDAARAQVDAARGQVALAQEEVRYAETRLEKATIRAPLDGVVALRAANRGDLVGEPGSQEPMFKVVDNGVLDLTVNVPAAALARLQPGQPLAFTTEAYGDRRFSGTVMFINPTVDSASRTVKVVAEVPNPADELRGGMFVRGEILLGRRENVLVAPREALLEWDVDRGTGAVFVVNGDVAHRRAVQTGQTAGDDVEIASGLEPGELVVARGAFNLRDGDKVFVASRANQ